MICQIATRERRATGAVGCGIRLPAKPRPIIAQVEGSGTEVVDLGNLERVGWGSRAFGDRDAGYVEGALSTKVKRPFDVEPVIAGVPSPGRLAPGTVASSVPVNVISPEVVWMVRTFSASSDPM